MCEPVLISFFPFLLLLILAAWGIGMTKASKIKRPEDPIWPFAENPVLALELADSIEFVNKVLGTADIGKANRDAARRLQKLDFVFIVFYVLFFISVPWARSGWSRGVIVIIVLALLTGIFDVIENYQVLRLLRNVEESSAKRFGQTKWFFYFATLGAEGSLFFFEHPMSNVAAVLGKLLGASLIAIAVGGIISSVKGSFDGISSATKLSIPGLLCVGINPVITVNSLLSIFIDRDGAVRCAYACSAASRPGTRRTAIHSIFQRRENTPAGLVRPHPIKPFCSYDYFACSFGHSLRDSIHHSQQCDGKISRPWSFLFGALSKGMVDHNGVAEPSRHRLLGRVLGPAKARPWSFSHCGAIRRWSHHWGGLHSHKAWLGIRFFGSAFSR